MTAAPQEFTKKTLAVIEAELIAAMKGVADRHGIQAKFTGGQFSSLEAILKLTISMTTPDGLSPEAARYKEMCAMLKLPALGTRFSTNGKTYEITGMHRTKDRSVMATRLDNGKPYVFYPIDVKRLTAVMA